MAIITTTKLIVGRGRLYFGRFRPGTTESEGEMYLGNTPGFSIGRSVEEIQRFTSYGGQQIQLESEIVRETNAANLVFDSMSTENIALWFGGEQDETGQRPIGTITETFVVKHDRSYQLGTSIEPFGVNYIEPDFVIVNGGSTIPADGNIEMDRALARFTIVSNPEDILDGDTLEITFQWRGADSITVTTAPKPVIGQLRFIAANPVGQQIDYFFPYVNLKPQGSFDVKSDQWQQMQLTADIRKLNPMSEFIYVLRRGSSNVTSDEEAIVEVGLISLEEFPFWEDELDIIVNVNMPAADYSQPIIYP